MDSHDIEAIVTAVILSLLLVTSLIGNCLTIVATMRNTRLRSYTSLLVCNLAVSDFMITCINLPIRILQLFGSDWSTHGLTQCKANVAITCFLFTTSNANLFLITLDRFLGVSFPLRYRGLMTLRKLVCAVFLAWIYAFMVATFPFVVAGEKPVVEENDSAAATNGKTESTTPVITVCTFSTALNQEYLLFVEFGTFFTSWLLMLVMYVCILKTLYASQHSKLRSIAQLSNSSTVSNNNKSSTHNNSKNNICKSIKINENHTIIKTHKVLQRTNRELSIEAVAGNGVPQHIGTDNIAFSRSVGTTPAEVDDGGKLHATRKESRGVQLMRTIRREVKLAKSVLIILMLYTILLVPIATIDIVDTISGEPIVPLIVVKVALVLAYANPAVNPPVYALTSSRYREAFARLLCCSTKKHGGRRESNVNNLSRRFKRKEVIIERRNVVAKSGVSLNVNHKVGSEFV